jgi:hypothetical protein
VQLQTFAAELRFGWGSARMNDWMTVTLELVGIVILVVWTVIPIREFSQILRRIRATEAAERAAAADGRSKGDAV